MKPAPAHQVSIIETLDDPHLFAALFTGTSWTAWRAFLAALFALPMDADTLALYQRHTGRTAPPLTAFTEAALIVGRRGGKSRVLALLAVYLAVFRDYRDRLAPGEAATIAVIAADRKQARSIMRFIVGMFSSVPMLAPLLEGRTAESLTLTNGIVVEIATASFRVTRGYSLVAAICDEIAFFRTEDSSANPAEEILRALRPGLANLGGLLLMASSPYDKRGPLYAAFRKHWGQDGARVLVWRGATLEMNPSLDPRIVEEAREDDPQNAAAEFDALFRDDIAQFVTREAVDGCTAPGRYELPPLSGTRYAAFVDPSGGSADSMTLAIAHADGKRAVLDAVRERKPPFSPESVVVEFVELLKAYRINTVTGDRYAGEWPRERFRENGITYDCSEKPKGDLYRDILPLLNSGQIELLDLPRVAAQLCSLERRTARGGRDSIDHPPGGHDDAANSVAGALLLVSSKRRPFVFTAEHLAAI